MQLLIEHQFSEVKKTSNSFTNELAIYYDFGWLYEEYI